MRIGFTEIPMFDIEFKLPRIAMAEGGQNGHWFLGWVRAYSDKTPCYAKSYPRGGWVPTAPGKMYWRDLFTLDDKQEKYTIEQSEIIMAVFDDKSMKVNNSSVGDEN